MLIDKIFPQYDQRQFHEIHISGDRSRVYKAVRFLDWTHSPIIRHLFRLRGIPADCRRLDDLFKLGFLLIDEVRDEELVLGLIGKFWTRHGAIERVNVSQYQEFDRKGFAKAAWNFAMDETAPGIVRLSSETRVLCMDDSSRRRFRLYWSLIAPFSSWIRRQMLSGVKKELGTI